MCWEIKRDKQKFQKWQIKYYHPRNAITITDNNKLWKEIKHLVILLPDTTFLSQNEVC